MEVYFPKQAVFSKFQGMEGFYLSKRTHKKNMIQGHSNSVIVRMMKWWFPKDAHTLIPLEPLYLLAHIAQRT